MRWTKWQKVAVADPLFRGMRHVPGRGRRECPYIEIDGQGYRVQRVVDDYTAFVTPLEWFGVTMRDTSTPFVRLIQKGDQDDPTTGDVAGAERGRVSDDL